MPVAATVLASRLLLLAVATSTAVALVLATGQLETAVRGDVSRGRPRPAAPAPMIGASQRGRLGQDFAGDDIGVMSCRRDLLGAAAEEEQDYGYVDPPPDTHRRGGTAPIPHK